MSESRSGRLRWGPVLMLLAALSFTLMVSCVKVARTEMSAFDVVWWRGLVSVPLCMAAVRRGHWRIHRLDWFTARVVFGFIAMACYFSAAGGLPVANLTLITRLQPIAIALVAPLMLGAGEAADRRTWVLSLLGGLGCAVLLTPEVQSGNPAGYMALGAVVASALSHTSLRALGPTEQSQTLVFWFQLCVTIGALGWIALRDGALPVLPPVHLAPWLLGVGFFAALGQSLLTRAYQMERAALVAAASHASPIFALLIDLVAFAHTPSWTTLLGGIIVMGAALALVFAPASRTDEPPTATTPQS